MSPALISDRNIFSEIYSTSRILLVEFCFYQNYSMEFNRIDKEVPNTTGGTQTETTTLDTFMEEVKTYMTFKIATFLATYWFTFIVPIGIVGNALSFLVMIKPNNRKVSTCIYMAAISINDNIMMGLCLDIFLVIVLKVHMWSPVECKIASFTALFALQNCTFLILAMTVDKYIAVKWPHRAAIHSTPGRARITATCVYLCVFMYNIPHFFLSGMIGDQCIAFAISGLITRTYSWLSFVVNAVIPFSLLIHMNYVIVKTVRASRKMFRSNGNNTSEGKEKRLDTRQKTMKSAENQLTIMLLLVTTLFLILLCPTYFRFIYMAFAKRDTPSEYAKSMLIYQITSKLYTSNSGINFFLYCISGKKFRNDLKEILCCWTSDTAGNISKESSQPSEINTQTSI